MSHVFDVFGSEWVSLRQQVEDDYKNLVIKGYKMAGGNVSHLALGLGLSRGTMTKFLQKNFGTNYKRVLLSLNYSE